MMTDNTVKVPGHPSVWRSPAFMILLVAGAVMALGNKIYELALPLILYDLTRSSIVMSTMRGIEFLPNLLLAMFIGVLVDRVHKKRWSLTAIAVQIVILTGLYISVENGSKSVVLFYIAGFLLMTFGYAYSNARVAMVKHSLPASMLTSANASYNFVTTFVGIAGPLLSGILLMLPDIHVALLLTAIAFVFAFVILAFIKTDEEVKPRTAMPAGFWKELHAGWTELRTNRLLWCMTVAVVFLNSTSGMVDTTIIFFAKDVLNLDNAQLGIVFSAAGIGGLAGSILIGRLRRYLAVGQLITLSSLCVGLTSIIFYLTNSAYILALGLFLYGCFETISTVSIWTFRQETTPYQLIGRVSGITGSIFKLGMPFAIMASGWISEFISPRLVFLITLAGNLLIFIGCMASPLWRARGLRG
ncbi:MFS transporter [Paenibacillus sp. PK3_47]|uniref:MFS transporter n=1 Tax=Paenibacillus sp. PK3_47 TaxID=2072642 RepID=UPI00201D4F93|nr:MFS transporter [Paenibacillus sp. PK3_47]UQZ36673.1 MFS transporter [Paenibacillus sp. PK3_47]